MSLLDEIVSATRSRVASAKAQVPADALLERIEGSAPPAGFRAALDGEGVAVIAEIKRRSPSAGELAPDADAAAIARDFAAGGAAAISVLTEPDRFSGSLEDLPAARAAGLPLLRKDFIVDPYQVVEARAWGADAVLLIVRIVGDELVDLLAATRLLGMDALVEVFDERDVDLAQRVGADLVGINNRDLDTLEVDLERTPALAKLFGPETLLVALSGVSSRAEVEAAADAGARAVLVGEALMSASDRVGALRELRG